METETEKPLPPFTPREMISLKDASKALGISYTFVRNMVRAGQIRTVMIGNSHRITGTEMNRIFEDGL